MMFLLTFIVIFLTIEMIGILFRKTEEHGGDTENLPLSHDLNVIIVVL